MMYEEIKEEVLLPSGRDSNQDSPFDIHKAADVILEDTEPVLKFTGNYANDAVTLVEHFYTPESCPGISKQALVDLACNEGYLATPYKCMYGKLT
mmetsp:Transcript_38965/g.44558  ORF Transcript_38965/g.44558 Transcript_38965/m.44558 type:complete len:95 (+) Transcript_38965:16-300(+)